MKRRITKAIPIIISLLLSFTIITVAWIVQDAEVKGIRIVSSGDGVTLKIKESGSYTDMTNSLSMNMDLTMKPCTYIDGYWYDKDGNNVTTNQQYVKKIELAVGAEKACTLYATKTVTGTLPIGVIINGTPIGTSTSLGSNNGVAMLTVCFYIDEYIGTGESTVEILLHGEA